MTSNKERLMILGQLDQTLQTYCSGCFLYTQNKKDSGRSYAHQFCLSSCTVGAHLRIYGDKLNQHSEK